jgi:hypothetical protein
MLWAFESTLDWRLNLQQHSSVALCDALCIRVHLGLALELAAVLALALFSVTVVCSNHWGCTLWMLSVMLWAHESALGFCLDMCQHALSLVGAAVDAALFGRSQQCLLLP